MFDWDDLRIFVAAARGGSFALAAQRLGIDPATVSRRIARFETVLKATLFVRSVGGLQLTAAGARVLELGQAAEAAMEAAWRVGEPDLVGGTVRLSMPEGFGTVLVAPALAALRQARPTLRIEIAITSGTLSPAKREVDVAVTLSAPASGRLHVEPLAEYELGLYASASYLERVGAPRSVGELVGLDIVGYVDDLVQAPELRYLDEVRPGLLPALSSSSIRGQQAVIAAAGGIGVLPCFMAGSLQRVLAHEVRLSRRFWLATRPEVLDTARVRLLRTWLRDLVRERRLDLRPSAVA